MTIDEALVIGCKELGWTEDQIAQSKQFANQNAPNTEPWGALPIPDGKEREFIEQWKAMTRLPPDIAQVVHDYCRKKVMEHDSKN